MGLPVSVEWDKDTGIYLIWTTTRSEYAKNRAFDLLHSIVPEAGEPILAPEPAYDAHPGNIPQTASEALLRRDVESACSGPELNVASCGLTD